MGLFSDILFTVLWIKQDRNNPNHSTFVIGTTLNIKGKKSTKQNLIFSTPSKASIQFWELFIFAGCNAST